MKYLVLKTNHEHEIKLIPNTAYLVEDQWDDWFQYSTMYDLWVIDSSSEKLYMGKVKIGQHNMKPDQRRPNIPNEFPKLDESFFSLGQNDYYYENIKGLGFELREEILNDLNDIAIDEEKYKSVQGLNVTQISLLRDISIKTVKIQFRRIAKGGARLTPYSFKYKPYVSDKTIKAMDLSFDVIPESNPPTNIHVIIGRNGVGKTHLIKNMIRSIVTEDEKQLPTYGIFESIDYAEQIFSKVLFISFSAFDELIKVDKPKMPYIRIGLPNIKNNSEINSQDALSNHFVSSFKACSTGLKRALLIKAVNVLRSDPIFAESGIIDYCTSDDFDELELSNVFKRLSSGHKVIILTITRLVQKVEEKTLVFLDEPEGHLHPPLLSAFIRSLSELLVDRNGVAIIATHSPVILQEVPRSCVWKIRRNGNISKAERLQIESFGESISSLTTEVFGLEVTHSGFHNLIEEAVKKYGDYDVIVKKFGGEIGLEAKAILKALIATYNEEE